MSVELFRYTARNGEGGVVTGAVRASSPLVALTDLRRRALYVTSISKSRQTYSRKPIWGRRRALLGFFRAFATLLRCGVTIRRGLEVAGDRVTDRGLREALRAVLADVEEGTTLSSALERRPREFSALHVAMIGAAEEGGALDRVAGRIAEALDREHTLRKRLQGAIMYPAIVALVAVTLLVFMLVTVVPTFAAIFERFGVSLPPSTRLLLEIRGVLVAPVSWVVGGALIVAIQVISSIRGWPGSIELDHMRLRLPVVGPYCRASASARVTRMLGVLLGSGVGLLRALDVVAPVAGSPVYAQALHATGVALGRGEGLTTAIASTRVFEPLVVALVGIGEESGALDDMLLAAAGYLEIEVEATLTTLAALVEPALIGLLGFLVAAIVFSMFLPLYSLLGSVT